MYENAVLAESFILTVQLVVFVLELASLTLYVPLLIVVSLMACSLPSLLDALLGVDFRRVLLYGCTHEYMTPYYDIDVINSRYKFDLVVTRKLLCHQ